MSDNVNILGFEIPRVYSLCGVVGGNADTFSKGQAVNVTQLISIEKEKIYIWPLIGSFGSGRCCHALLGNTIVCEFLLTNQYLEFLAYVQPPPPAEGEGARGWLYTG